MTDGGPAKLRLVIELEYDPEAAHGDDADSIQWFKDLLAGNDLWLSDFGDWGDAIGKVRVVEGLALIAARETGQ